MFLKALELNPDSVEANSLIGSCYLLLNKPDLAEGFLYAAVMLSEWKDAVSIANLAESLRLNNDPNLAVQVAMKGYENLGQKDDSGLIQYVLGASYRDQKKYSLSSDWFLSSALRQPKNIDAWVLASTMHFPDSDRDYKLAENVLLQGMHENEGNVDLVFQMGLVMHHSNNLEQALKCYDFVLSQNAEHKDALSMSATALHTIGGRSVDAFHRYNSAIKHNPDNAILLSNFGLLLHSSFRDQVNSNDIVALAEKALAIDSSIPEAIKLINMYKKV